MKEQILKPELVTVGHIYSEMIKFPNRTLGPMMGSPAAHTSVIATKLGVKAAIVTKIGSDFPGDLLRVFSEAGVDTRGIKTVGEPSTATLLTYNPSGNKRVQYINKAPDIFFDDIPKDYLNAKVIYICPVDYEVPLETVRELNSLGETLAVDLMGYGGATCRVHPEEKEQKSHQALKGLIKYFHIVRASIEDCRYFFETKEAGEEDIAYLFTEWGADIGIVTLGEKGVIIATKDQKFKIPAIPAKVKDCTGAGDAFAAGFLAEYLKTKNPHKSGLFGVATASLVIEGQAGVYLERMPTACEVQDRISSSCLPLDPGNQHK